MTYEDDHYSKLKPTLGETKYIEYDKEFGWWALFGEDSGFCYRQFSSQHEAEKYLTKSK